MTRHGKPDFRTNLSAWAVLAVLASAGCGILPDARRDPRPIHRLGWKHHPPEQAVPAGVVRVGGGVAAPGPIPLGPEGVLTLGQAVAAAGGVVPIRDLAGKPVEALIRFTQGETLHYFSTHLLANPSVSGVVLTAGTSVAVVPWTETGLAAGVSQTVRVVEVDSGGGKKELALQVRLEGDFDALKAFYRPIPDDQDSVPVSVDVAVGREPLALSSPLYFAPEYLAHPYLGEILSLARFQQPLPFVALLERFEGAQRVRYVLPSQNPNDTPVDGDPYSVLVGNAPLREGDRVTLTLPDAIPVVAASTILRARAKPATRR